jgi:hypothetical protein
MVVRNQDQGSGGNQSPSSGGSQPAPCPPAPEPAKGLIAQAGVKPSTTVERTGPDSSTRESRSAGNR